jgi:hypothetical protein
MFIDSPDKVNDGSTPSRSSQVIGHTLDLQELTLR